MGDCISADRILGRLDEYLDRKDFAAAERHLDYWLAEAMATKDTRTELLVRNERLGLLRKLSRQEEALAAAEETLLRIDALGLTDNVGGATTLLNCATVFKAFLLPARALSLFERARTVYERALSEEDSRLGGLYNNMALALVDLGRFSEAAALYRRAIAVMERVARGELEVAITYLNMAEAAEAENGALLADETVRGYLASARALLDAHTERDGYYAFVCEKCASVYSYYGQFAYAADLEGRARRIYEGT